ncbi:12147_t:CDS:2, partial [Racocetra fulgida]
TSDFVQKDGVVRSLDHQIWGTVLVTSFLKVLLWNERREWRNIYNRAESWLSENVTDVENESGFFELTTQLAEALGFSSAEGAKKHIETHFSSYSPITSQFDVNVWSTAILIWFIRYVLVDFRSEWADVYQKTNNWLCQQVKDDKVREELLEASRNFVVKRFEVEQDAIEEDETFKESIEANEKYRDSEVVRIIRICVKSAKNLKKKDSRFTFSNSDPYVRIMDASRIEVDRTCVHHETVNPKWEEVHFASVHSLGEKISFEIFDENLFVSDEHLGTYVLDTNTLMNYEDHSKPISDWYPLQISKKPVEGHLNLEIQFIPTVFTEKINNIEAEDRLYDLCKNFIIERFKVKNLEKEQLEIITPVKQAIITRKNINIRYICTLIGHQDDDGCVTLNEK